MSEQRQIVLDTETTGLAVEEGHRIIEIAGIELLSRRPSGRSLHFYLNPERDIDVGALAVHGLTLERLSTEPVFAQVATQVVDFIRDAELLIHNAAFDVGFINAEFARLGLQPLSRVVTGITDTLTMARQMHPGRRNSLDALCERYGVSNAHRTLHGALLDAQLLAEVYLAMTRGQDSLEIAAGGGELGSLTEMRSEWPPTSLTVLAPTTDELGAHREVLAAIARETRKPALWEHPSSA
jgi:DNA polymerase-3 subunit epsilon